MILIMVVAVVIGLLVVGIGFVESRKMNRKGMYRYILLLNLVPVLFFIGFIELVVVPNKGAQYAASLYPVFLVCFQVPSIILTKRALSKNNGVDTCVN